MTNAAATVTLPPEKDLRILFPQARATAIPALLKAEPLLREAGILNTPSRLAMFIAQVGHETAGLTRLKESLTYSAERLCQVWPSRFPTIAAARPYAGNPAALAEKVYGGRMGNTKPGDGFRYLGRGGLMITGLEAYMAIQKITGLPLVAQPMMAETPDGAIAVAVGVWIWKQLNPLCDQPDALEATTRKINGGLIGLDDRRNRFRLARDFIRG